MDGTLIVLRREVPALGVSPHPHAHSVRDPIGRTERSKRDCPILAGNNPALCSPETPGRFNDLGEA
jgi:hypothetical protein